MGGGIPAIIKWRNQKKRAQWLSGEKECRGRAVEGLKWRIYRLERTADGASERLPVTLNIAQGCIVDYCEDLSSLDVVLMRVENPDSVAEAQILLLIGPYGDEGPEFICRAPLSTLGPMEFTCPPEAGDVRYVLRP